jgi:membrane protease YdiL (CAAX protease family)
MADTSLSNRNWLLEQAALGRRKPAYWRAAVYLVALIMAMIFAAILLVIIGMVSLLAIKLVVAGFDIEADSYTTMLAASFGSFAVVFLVTALFTWWEGRPFHTIGLRTANPLREWARGFALGLLMLAASVGISAALGWMDLRRVGGAPGDGPLTVLGWMALALLYFLVQGPAEEVLGRGYLLPVLGKRGGLWVGIAVSSLIFALMHGANPSIGPIPLLNLFLAGAFFCFYALKEAGLWGVFGWHSAWNWVQGAVFGLEVSGMGEFSAHPLLNFDEAGPDWMTGGPFGPEGGAAVTIVLLLGIGLLLWLFWKESRRSAATAATTETCL